MYAKKKITSSLLMITNCYQSKRVIKQNFLLAIELKTFLFTERAVKARKKELYY